MKKHQTYRVLCLALLFCCGSANAKVNHYVGGYIQAGEWSLLPSQSEYSASLGGAGGVGFLYEMQAGKNYKPVRFLLDVGLGASGGMTAYAQKSDRMDTLPNQQDLDGENFNYIYEIKDRQDRYVNIAVQLPIMVGLKYKRFYALAGVKVYANIWTMAYSKANMRTYGRYSDFGIFGEDGWPEYQFFTSEPISTNVKAALNLDVDASAEIGFRLNSMQVSTGFDVPKSRMEYRLAVFADYGLFDVRSGSNKPSVILPAKYDTDPNSANYIYNTRTMVDNLVMNDIMCTDGFAKAVKNLFVGVKFTILFQLPEPEKCVLCGDSYRSTVRSYGGSRKGVQYDE